MIQELKKKKTQHVLVDRLWPFKLCSASRRGAIHPFKNHFDVRLKHNFYFVSFLIICILDIVFQFYDEAFL